MSDCINFTGFKNDYGYGKIKRDGKIHYAHRYFYSQANGKIPDGMLVCHSCDNPSCINVDHLFLGTHKDNSDDKISKGRDKYADQSRQKNGNAKITEEDVSNIKRMISDGLNNKEIARKFGVSHSNISLIRNKKTWS